MGLDTEELSNSKYAPLFVGNAIPDGSTPLALAYAGHQFGHFTMLGDGRAHLLGEHIAPDGTRYDVQLKGSGRTRFSRGGDGRAALGPMLREYLVSEAVHALGIPTTRSLAVTTTGETVQRRTPLRGAVLTRVARSHIRVGTFEYAALLQDISVLKALADYTIRRHFHNIPDEALRYEEMLRSVVGLQANLVANWMLVGFIHGVMNTDNMATSGETIDYGPCAFMNAYNLETVFSSIDTYGRYAYGAQPHIAMWNLQQLATALEPLFHSNPESSTRIGREIVETFPQIFNQCRLDGFKKKLGMTGENPADGNMVDSLLRWMESTQVDFTLTFRYLTTGKIPDEHPFTTITFRDWHERWAQRLASQQGGMDAARQRMATVNPVVVPRNHLVEAALDAASSDLNLAPFLKLLDAVTQPFNPAFDAGEFALPPSPVQERNYRTFCGT